MVQVKDSGLGSGCALSSRKSMPVINYNDPGTCASHGGSARDRERLESKFRPWGMVYFVLLPAVLESELTE